MAATYVLTATGQNDACNGHVDELNSGFIKVRAADDTLLFTCTFGNPAFGNAGASVDGRASANPITDGVAVASGTAAKATIHKSDDTEVGEANVSTSDAAVNIPTLAIVEGQTYGISGMNITMPTQCA